MQLEYNLFFNIYFDKVLSHFVIKGMNMLDIEHCLHKYLNYILRSKPHRYTHMNTAITATSPSKLSKTNINL